MKITGYLYSAPPARVVGGEVMTLRLLDRSARQGHDVSVVVHTLNEPAMYGAVKLIPGYNTALNDAVRAIDSADLIVTHPEIGKHVWKFTSRAARIPAIGIVHNLGPNNITGLQSWSTMTVVANSHYTARQIVEHDAFKGRKVAVIYPPVKALLPPVQGLPRAFCTMVNISAAKGSAMLQTLVSELPEVPFMAVLGGHGAQEPPKHHHGNVTLFGHYSGLHLPYGLTRVLISPSEDETYGMVVCEAAALGIPVVLSDIPAHREALGEAGIYRALDDESGWISAVRTLMADDAAWEAAHHRMVEYGAVLYTRQEQTYTKWDQLVLHVASRNALV
jgi:hypothetical protein